MRRGNWKLTLSSAMAAAALAGCAAPSVQQVNQSGYSPAFRQGYADGCNSAGTRKQLRNDARYKRDADYMIGWDDGFNACRR